MSPARRIVAGGLVTAALLCHVAPASAATVSSATRPSSASAYGSRVAWSDRGPEGDLDVYVYDLLTKKKKRVGVAGSDQVNPAIGKDWVVWADDRNGDFDLYARHLVTGEERRVTYNSDNQNSPSISGSRVAYEDYRNGQAQAIYMSDIVTGEERLVASSSSIHRTRPKISGSLIVWEERLGTDTNVVGYDITSATKFNVAATAVGELLPDTDGRWVAWVEPNGATGLDIAAYDTVAARKIVVARDGEQTMPTLGAGYLHWIDTARGNRAERVYLSDPALAVSTTPKTPATEVWSIDSEGKAVGWLVRTRTGWKVGADERYIRRRLPRAVAMLERGLSMVAAWLQPTLPAASAGPNPPTSPFRPKVVVKNGSVVRVSWGASTDADGDPIVYDVYRRNLPIPNSAAIGSSTLVASGVSGLSTDITPGAGEAASSYVYYYAVVARDSDGNVSVPSYNLAPNPHGTHRSFNNIWNCQICHDAVHGNSSGWGALGADTRFACYECHGLTDASSTFGTGAVVNTQREFRDYAGQTGSRHRNSYMESEQSDCSSCHTPHRASYYLDSSGAYVASLSHRRLLRTMETSNPAAYTYSTDTTPSANGFCFACHGNTVTPMLIAGGPLGYANAGGDHETSYGVSAHSSPTVRGDDSNPGIQCRVCHDSHGSPVARLVDYRASGTNTTANAEAGLCYRCHSSGSTEASSTGTKPFTWNGRYPATELARASAHTTATSATGPSATCASCHNTHQVQKGGATAWSLARVSDPRNTNARPTSWASFCIGCHTTTPPVAGGGATFYVPYTVRFASFTASYFPGWDKSLAAAGGHNVTTGTKAQCNNCHDPHGSDFERLLAWTRPSGWSTGPAGSRANTSSAASLLTEEALCFNCHGNGTVGKGTTMAPDVATPMSAPYRHPTTSTAYAGRHSDVETGDSLSNRHAECVDCHDPHAARKSGGTALHKAEESTPGGALRGAVGVYTTEAGNWTTPGDYEYAAEVIDGESTDYEAYVCFKCHSNAFGVQQPPGQTNLALEFNTNNYSRHNVLGSAIGGKKTFNVSGTDYNWTTPTVGVFTGAWDWNSKMTCTDCHTGGSLGQAKGPHGSSVDVILDPAFPTDWKTAALYANSANGMTTNGSAAATIICAKCHDLYDNTARKWSNGAHGSPSNHGWGKAYCNSCHISIPHGWKRPRLLGYESDPLPYRPRTGFLQGVQVRSITLGSGGVASWSQGNCQVGCASHATTPIWP